MYREVAAIAHVLYIPISGISWFQGASIVVLGRRLPYTVVTFTATVLDKCNALWGTRAQAILKLMQAEFQGGHTYAMCKRAGAVVTCLHMNTVQEIILCTNLYSASNYTPLK